MSLVEQELLALPEHISASPVLSEVRVARSSVLNVCFDYPFVMLKLVFRLIVFNKVPLCYLDPLVVCCQTVELYGIPILTLKVHDDGYSRNTLGGTDFDIYVCITISWSII